MTRVVCDEKRSEPRERKNVEPPTNASNGKSDGLYCKVSFRQSLVTLGFAFHFFWFPAYPTYADTSDAPAQDRLAMNDFVTDAVKLQEATSGQAYKTYIAPYMGTLALRSHADLFSGCVVFEYSVFAHENDEILTRIDHSAEEFSELFTNRENEEVLVEPRKIAVLIDYILSRPVSATRLATSGKKTANDFNRELWQDRERESDCSAFEADRKKRGLTK